MSHPAIWTPVLATATWLAIVAVSFPLNRGRRRLAARRATQPHPPRAQHPAPVEVEVDGSEPFDVGVAIEQGEVQ